MYKNAKLYAASLSELIERDEGSLKSRQTIIMRDGRRMILYANRGDCLATNKIDELCRHYRKGRLYFKL